MERSIPRRLVAVAAVITLAAACEQNPVAVDEPVFQADVSTPTPGISKVQVCKDGPSGYTFSFTVAADAQGNGGSGVTLYNDGSFTLQAGECVDAAVTSAANNYVTATENAPPAGTKFTKVELYSYTTLGAAAGQLVLQSTSTTDPNVTVGPFGNDQGWVVVYTNEELPVVSLPGRMTGGGSVFMGDVRFTHGFELHCDPNDLPNNLEVNWPDHRFHLTSLTSVVCTDDPDLDPLPRKAGFDTYTATGVGLLNGQPGATIEFVFTDDGEPGKNDYAMMKITAPGGSSVTVSGYLYKGNHQAHWVN